MTMTISGDSGLVFPDSSKLATQLGIFNRIINGGFIINQRVYVSNTALSAGVYAHDRWKAGASGCTYTFTQGSLGVNTTINITAGSLQQVIEGCNVPEGGTYTLSWTGTAQARVGSGSYSSSPLTVTGITAGANTTVEFSTGTVGYVQFETGNYPSNFAYRPYGTELALCQRYAWVPTSPLPLGSVVNATIVTSATVRMPVTMRAAPTLGSGATYAANAGSAGTVSTLNITGARTTADAVPFTNAAANWTTNAVVELVGAVFSAEL